MVRNLAANRLHNFFRLILVAKLVELSFPSYGCAVPFNIILFQWFFLFLRHEVSGVRINTFLNILYEISMILPVLFTIRKFRIIVVKDLFEFPQGLLTGIKHCSQPPFLNKRWIINILAQFPPKSFCKTLTNTCSLVERFVAVYQSQYLSTNDEKIRFVRCFKLYLYIFNWPKHWQ